jgi:hypothetical protein
VLIVWYLKKYGIDYFNFVTVHAPLQGNSTVDLPIENVLSRNSSLPYGVSTVIDSST